VDEWLRVNASCPTCRMSLFQEGQSSGDEDDNDIEMNQGGTRRIGNSGSVTSREEKSSRNAARSGQQQTPYDPETRPLRSSS
jgi:hypothetical protein